MRVHIYEQITKLVPEDVEELLLNNEIVRPSKRFRFNFNLEQQLVPEDVVEELLLNNEVVRPSKQFRFNLLLEQQLVPEDSVLNNEVVRPSKQFRFNLLLEQQLVPEDSVLNNELIIPHKRFSNFPVPIVQSLLIQGAIPGTPKEIFKNFTGFSSPALDGQF